MGDMLLDYYLWLKAGHIISVLCWMAVMFYLPRLYVYHTQVQVGSDQSELFKIMEYKLFRYIGNPSMIATWVFAGLMIWADPNLFTQGWFHAKLACVILLSGFHGACSKWRKNFANDINTKSEKFYRVANEIPTILMLVIVIMAVVKPF